MTEQNLLGKASPKMKLESPIKLYFNNQPVLLKDDGNGKRYVGIDGTNTFVIFGVDLEIVEGLKKK